MMTKRDDENGAALVELSITAPVVILFFLFSVQIALYYFQRHRALDVGREAALEITRRCTVATDPQHCVEVVMAEYVPVMNLMLENGAGLAFSIYRSNVTDGGFGDVGSSPINPDLYDDTDVTNDALGDFLQEEPYTFAGPSDDVVVLGDSDYFSGSSFGIGIGIGDGDDLDDGKGGGGLPDDSLDGIIADMPDNVVTANPDITPSDPPEVELVAFTKSVSGFGSKFHAGDADTFEIKSILTNGVGVIVELQIFPVEDEKGVFDNGILGNQFRGPERITFVN